jgi:HEAT repeat protein
MKDTLKNLTIPQLIAVLKADGFSPEWEEAVILASQTATEEDFCPLVALLDESERSTRQQAANVLAKLENPLAARLLIEKALEGHDEHIEKAAVTALMRWRECAVQLFQDVMVEGTGIARIRAALILAESGNAAGLDILLGATNYEDESDGFVGLLPRILEALGDLRDARAVPFLTGFFGKNHWLLRLVAAKSLVKIGEPAVESLLEIAKHSRDLDARCRAVEALGQIGSSLAVRPLVELLDDGEGPLQSEVIKALGRIGGPASIEALVQILNGRDALMYFKVSTALVRIGRPALPGLIRLLKEHPNPDARRCAAAALGQIGDASAVPALIDALTDKNSLVRKAATDALGQLKDPSAVDPLCQLLERDNWFVARGAAEALAKIGDGRAIGPLLRALENDRTEIREQIVKSLLSFHTVLNEMIADSRAEEAKDQCSFADQPASCSIVDLLANTLHDDAPIVRINAAKLLVRLKGEAVKARIEAILQDHGPGDVEVRQALLELDRSAIAPSGT